MAQETTQNTPRGFEYRDHTADIQIHSWGKDLSEAFEEATLEVTASGHDLESLLFDFMSENLTNFCIDFLLPKQINITSFDRENFKITATLKGEKFSKKKHEQGTEIKAITYSNMQISESKEEGKAEIFVIVDI